LNDWLINVCVSLIRCSCKCHRMHGPLPRTSHACGCRVVMCALLSPPRYTPDVAELETLLNEAQNVQVERLLKIAEAERHSQQQQPFPQQQPQLQQQPQQPLGAAPSRSFARDPRCVLMLAAATSASAAIAVVAFIFFFFWGGVVFDFF
jgi:hypothetical protein